ncbi:RNA polymerase sigma-70 factor [Prevotella sp. 10(H)]|uniref:RNA polymerase sigma-70 factor n=1 Tax=Prevotella sp. 10(H) TaxID=1158294 RepID=UPI000562F2DF|nr:RNA polymerase sigma-70 factor [Prevotella sp. 10(H)]
MTIHTKEGKYLENFQNLFSEYYESLCLFAYKYVRNKDIAEDIVQDTFFSLWNNQEDIDFSQPKPLLYKYVKNRAIDFLRQAQTRNISLNTDDISIKLDNYVRNLIVNQQEEDFHYKQLQIELNKCIEDLPPQCRRVFELSRFSNLKNKEIAEELQINIKTVEKHITTALLRIRQHLAKQGFIYLLFYYYLLH